MRLYASRFLNRDDEAYSLLSRRCRDSVDRAEFRDAMAEAAKMYGGAQITSFTEDEVKGDRALVSYEFTSRDIDQAAERWVYEAETWHLDDC